MSSSVRSTLGFIALLLAAFGAQAQAHRCVAGTTTYYSDRPCPIGGTIGGYGPVRQAPTYSAKVEDAPKAKDHVKYLSPTCASISEALRTGPTRGVRRDVIEGLQDEYRAKCAVEDEEAHKRARDERKQAREVQVAARDQAARERQQVAIRNDQCASMRDVIALKRQRESSLNATEVQALRELEKNYNQRCLQR